MNFGQLKSAVWSELDSSRGDPFYPEDLVGAALNEALVAAADRLAASGARRRYMRRVPDLSAADGFDASSLVWTLPSDFRRPFELVRGEKEIVEVDEERAFSRSGADRYITVDRELWLTRGTNPKGLEVWYIRTPARMDDDEAEPDWIEGYDRYLVLRAAASLLTKGDGDPSKQHAEADRLWPSVLLAARTSALPPRGRRRAGRNEVWG